MKPIARTAWILGLVAPPTLAQELVTILPGEESGGWYGASVAVVGDLDDDGLPDYVVGAPGEDDRGPGSGNVRVHSGRTGKLLHLIPGQAPGADFGRAVAALDDVDGDGYPDWAASAPGSPYLSGAPSAPRHVAVYSGRTGAQLSVIQAASPLESPGHVLRTVGDLDGDGLRDYAVSGGIIDAFRIYSSRTGELLRTMASIGDKRIDSVCGVDDVDGDGVDDLAAGYQVYTGFSVTSFVVEVVSGADGSLLWSLSSTTVGRGANVTAVGDLDGDGLRDLTVSNQAFRVWVHSLADGALLYTVDSNWGLTVGYTATSVGDVTGDGVDDLALEAFTREGAFPFYWGLTEVRIHSGADGTLVQGFQVWPGSENYPYYQSIGMAGDVDLDGDGALDLLVGVPGPKYQVGPCCLPAGEVRIYSSAPISLSADRNHLVLTRSGTQSLALDAGPAYAGSSFLMFGSTSGTQPPTLFQGSALPLVADKYFQFTATHPGALPLEVTTPTLDALGQGRAAFRWEGSTHPAWLGVTLHHAALVSSSTGTPLVSNPVPLVFQLSPCDTGNAWVLDCNASGTSDECEIRSGQAQDCNANGIPDDCDIAAATSIDCDFNGVPDECEADCNSNGVADACDIASGTSQDCNANGIPDECISLETDCNGNGLPDACDIAFGLSNDCNRNGIPDDCIWKEVDCNANGVPDSCDLAAGTSFDCNENGIPDECPEEIDLNANGIPDECEPEMRWYVDDDAPADPGPGDPTLSDPLEDGSPEHPFDSIQEAVSASTSHNVILLAEGLYSGPGNFDLDLTGRVLAFLGPGAPQACVIDAGGLGGAFRGVLRGSVFQGLTIRNASTTAIRPNEGPVTIRACAFEDCAQALSLRSVPSSIEAPNLVENCTFSGSLSSACHIAGRAVVRNSTFVRNQSSDKGGALNISAPTLVQGCTFFENTAVKGGAIYGLQFELENSILWGNTAPKGAQIKVATSMVVTHSDVQGGQAAVSANVGSIVTWGPGNLDIDPAFVDPLAGDVHLATGSPCIDQGDPTFEAHGQTDVDGQPRVMNGRVDMGADEVSFGTPGG